MSALWCASSTFCRRARTTAALARVAVSSCARREARGGHAPAQQLGLLGGQLTGARAELGDLEVEEVLEVGEAPREMIHLIAKLRGALAEVGEGGTQVSLAQLARGGEVIGHL